ncbi:hypothetical protein QQP08_002810, partial [Theobroma cacao]
MDKRVGLVRTSEVGGYSTKPKLRILRHWESLPQREKRTRLTWSPKIVPTSKQPNQKRVLETMALPLDL